VASVASTPVQLFVVRSEIDESTTEVILNGVDPRSLAACERRAVAGTVSERSPQWLSSANAAYSM
jgi:hypothetical protein